MPTFYHNTWAMRDTADVTGGNPIAVWSQSVSGVRSMSKLAGSYYKICGTESSTSDYTCWTLYRSYFKDISVNHVHAYKCTVRVSNRRPLALLYMCKIVFDMKCHRIHAVGSTQLFACFFAGSKQNRSRVGVYGLPYRWGRYSVT
jgi:hypothetical protein